MWIILNILEKTSELTELKNLIMSKNFVTSEKNQYSVKNDKHLLNACKCSAVIQKKKDALLTESKLISDEIEEITHWYDIKM